jgi:dienelactone hydrolase
MLNGLSSLSFATTEGVAHPRNSSLFLMHWLLIFCCLGSIGTTVSFLFSTTTILQPRISMTDDGFVPLNPESLSATSCLIEQTLCQPSAERPQLAKDFHYASAVLDAWRHEELNSKTAWCAEYKSVIYHDSDGTPLYGHWVRKQGSHESDNFGILLFHTGAGPHDVFLLWKAASLVMALNCQVLIADILSDESGWAWDLDRRRYETVRQQVLGGDGTRPLLQKRIYAAVSLLKNQVDENRLAALGWCLGGHSILELARMNIPEMRAMVTFHGVFDDIEAPAETAVSSMSAEVLVCNGVEDPFVSSQTLENALTTFQQYGHRLSLLQLKGAKHGFTNPAQDFNDNPAFAFHAESAHKSWHQATALLKRRCSNLP